MCNEDTTTDKAAMKSYWGYQGYQEPRGFTIGELRDIIRDTFAEVLEGLFEELPEEGDTDIDAS